MSRKPFRFAVQAFSADSAAAWKDMARGAEDLGYSAFHLADHFLGEGPALAATNHPHQTLAAIPAMTMAAAVTDRIKIGCRVFCIDYHHPVVLAKSAATIDVLSDGRLEFGLGAGWIEAEYAAAGIPFDRPGVRISRLEEYVGLFRALMSGEQVDHQGEFAKVSGFAGSPLPVQKPHPPIMIGGGAKRILSLAGREADIVSLNFNNRAGVIGPDGVNSSTADATAEKIEWIRAAAGERFADIELEIGAYFTVVTDQPRAVAEQMGSMMGLSTDEMMQHPNALFGSIDNICETLVERRERYGISYITVGGDNARAFAPVVARLAGK